MTAAFTLGLDVLTYGASWADALAVAQRADSLGYDQLFTADHLYATGGDPSQPFFEGWTTLAAWSQATTRVDLGLLVGANTFRNPGVVAKMAVTIDHASGGRAILGLGAAWEEGEQRAHGIEVGRSLGQRLEWLDESLSLIRRVLAGETVTSANDDHYRFDGVRHQPLPLRRPMPVIVGAIGEQRGLRIVAKHATLWQLWGEQDSTEEFQRLHGVLRRHCREVGRDDAEVAPVIGAKVIIRRSRAQAEIAFDRQLEVQPWRGEVLDHVRRAVWTTTADQATRAIERYLAAGARGFIAQVYPPYDHETIETLATTVRERVAAQGALP